MSNSLKNFSQASENNKTPILNVLEEWFADCRNILEIGSGTGQHALFFSAKLPHLRWHCSDLAVNHPSINAWLDDATHANFERPVVLDVSSPTHWESVRACNKQGFDGIFSANTAHIMPWDSVCDMFQGAASLLQPLGTFLLYGPFNRDGAFTSQGNEAFDRQLRASSPDMGIRDDRDIIAQAHRCDLELVDDVAMPANNRILIFRKN